MKTVSQTRQIYRPLDAIGPLATMRDVWRFATWVGDRLGHDITVEGVSRVRDDSFTAPQVTPENRAGVKLTAQRGRYRFARKHGLILRSEFAAYAAWLSAELHRRMSTDDLSVAVFLGGSASGVAALARVKTGGVLTGRELLAFMRAASAQLGFSVAADDIVGYRDTGHGLHVRRQLHTRLSLELELQNRTATAFTCWREIVDGVVYAVRSQTENFENGTITETQTAAGGVHLHTPSDSSYVCPEVDVSTDEDPEFDYGSPEGSEDPVYSGALDPALLLEAARTGAEDSGSPYVAQSWEWTNPEQLPPTGITQALGYWTAVPDALVARQVNSRHYRWRNTSLHALRITWDQGGSSFDVTIDAGEESDWKADVISDTEDVEDEITNVEITLA